MKNVAVSTEVHQPSPVAPLRAKVLRDRRDHFDRVRSARASARSLAEGARTPTRICRLVNYAFRQLDIEADHQAFANALAALEEIQRLARRAAQRPAAFRGRP